MNKNVNLRDFIIFPRTNLISVIILPPSLGFQCSASACSNAAPVQTENPCFSDFQPFFFQTSFHLQFIRSESLGCIVFVNTVTVLDCLPPDHPGFCAHKATLFLFEFVNPFFCAAHSYISFTCKSLPWRSYFLSRGRTQEPLEYIRVNPRRITVWMREYKNAQQDHGYHTTVKGYQNTSSKVGWGEVKG